MTHLPSDQKLIELTHQHKTPIYAYSLKVLQAKATELLSLTLPFGFTPRYAAKANMNPEIIKLFTESGLWFDASSSYEAMELVGMNVEPRKISLSSQQPAHNLDELLHLGVSFTATSLRQLELFISSPNHPREVGLRINPGTGAGYNNRLTTGGPNSSFGLWHKYQSDALEIARKAGIRITRLHIHYGTGTDPGIWGGVIEESLNLVADMPDVISLNVGGGYKIKYDDNETEANMSEIAKTFSVKLKEFAQKTGRKINLEVEPGRWLVAHAGTLLASVVDIVNTGEKGHTFLRLNTGMNDLIRPAMYGAQHKIKVLNNAARQEKYIVVGHNCETGDTFTTAPGNPEELAERELNRAAIGDVVAIYDTGAYGRYFAVQGYNSFPSANEIRI